MKLEKSCGIIPIFFNNREINVVLIKQNNGVVGFPKGHIQNGEVEEETAFRECEEETNLTPAIIKNFREEISYFMAEYNAIKKVVFFIGIVDCVNIQKQESEIVDIIICNVDDAIKEISYEDTKKVLIKAIDYLNGSFIFES